jgi:manganese/iron transport system ATP-binding protein
MIVRSHRGMDVALESPDARDAHTGLPDELTLRNVSVAYDGRQALEEVSFSVPHGAHVAVVGPNGAGKSTLMKAIVGLIPLAAGSIDIHGRPQAENRFTLAYVPQREEVDWSYPLTVRDVVTMGRYRHLGRLRRVGARDREAVTRALGALTITDIAERSIGELSGGQQQRVFLARALAQEPHVLLLDEPFTGVDATVREGILEVLADLAARGITVLASTHDLSLATQRFELALLLSRRLVAFGPARTAFTAGTVSRTFGSQATMIDGVVVIDQCCPVVGEES